MSSSISSNLLPSSSPFILQLISRKLKPSIINYLLFLVMLCISSYSAVSSPACCFGGLYSKSIVSLLLLLVSSSIQTESYLSESCFWFSWQGACTWRNRWRRRLSCELCSWKNFRNPGPNIQSLSGQWWPIFLWSLSCHGLYGATVARSAHNLEVPGLIPGRSGRNWAVFQIPPRSCSPSSE